MAFGGSGDRRGLRADINITPLVDVVLVLLIIFMVMTPVLLKRMDIQVPDEVNVEVETPANDQLVLKIGAAGELSLNHESLSREALFSRVQTALRGRAQKVVFFDIDDGASYAEVVRLMDGCRGAGAKVLGIMSKTPPK